MKPTGRPPHTLLGLTARQWAEADGSAALKRLRRAQYILAGSIEPGPHELARVADSTGVDLADLVRALASLRGYLPPDAPAGDPDGPSLADGD